MQNQVFNLDFHAMGSPCSLQFYAESRVKAEQVFAKVNQRIIQLEKQYSRYLDDSLVSLINRRAGTGVRTKLDAETLALLAYAEQCYIESDGLFDITSGVLRRVWRLNQHQVPSSEELQSILPLIGWRKVQWDDKSIYLHEAGMELDFGGIVKEYAADVAASICKDLGVNSGIVELGGDIRVIGPLPNGDGWPVAIRDPRQPESVVAQLELTTGALASSGDYERYQIIDGIRYSHILNPKTGWPVSGLRAVSIVADQCLIAGSVATIAMLKANVGLEWLQMCGMPYLSCRTDGKIVNHLFFN